MKCVMHDILAMFYAVCVFFVLETGNTYCATEVETSSVTLDHYNENLNHNQQRRPLSMSRDYIQTYDGNYTWFAHINNSAVMNVSSTRMDHNISTPRVPHKSKRCNAMSWHLYLKLVSFVFFEIRVVILSD